MIRSAVTLALVPQARLGPFVFHDDLEAGIRCAGELGFDAVELFLPGPDAVDGAKLRALLDAEKLDVAAVGTGAGKVVHGLTLTDASAEHREKAKQFVRSIIDFGGAFNAPAIIGSMQGSAGGKVDHPTAMEYLADALDELGAHARRHYNLPLIYEPLNRYETNLVNRVAEGVSLIKKIGDDGRIVLLADLFHMNIEEQDIAAAIHAGEGHIGHVHYVDSNRRPVGSGHIVYEPIVAALREIKYDGYLSAEAFPYPDSDSAATQTLAAFKKHFG